jgi:hypothetical protein
MGNHVHMSGIHVVTVGLSALLFIGVMNLAALKFKDSSKFWASYANLYMGC